MNTPKSQNPEGKGSETIPRWECRPLNWQVQYHQDDNGEWVKYSDHATTLTDIQADREVLISGSQELRAMAEKHWRRAEDAERNAAAMQRRLEALSKSFRERKAMDGSNAQHMREKTYEQCADEIDTLLRGDGKGDEGVSGG